MTAPTRMFPIMVSTHSRPNLLDAARERGTGFVVVAIPWDMIAPHAQQADRNHSQTLERLAERGGLCASEALGVLEGKEWGALDHDGARANEQLGRKVAEWAVARAVEAEAKREGGTDGDGRTAAAG